MDAHEPDRRSLLSRLRFSRRELLVGSVAAGFALAARPFAAQTVVTTDASGLEAGEVSVPLAEGSLPAYRARPAGDGRFPIVLVVHEIFGVHEHIRDVCRRLAKLGYLALAPDLFARRGDVVGMSDVQQILRDVVAKTPDREVLADLDATAAFAAESLRGDAARLGITGFCWGGRVTWLYAAHARRLRAAVAWYGRLSGVSSDAAPRHPLDVAGELRAPVLGLYGGADAGIPLADVEKMRAACAAAGRTCEIVVYPDAPHAFFADYRPSYRAEAARDGWTRMLEWLQGHGVA
jgi:carboxymethylenebutenolidase